MNQQELMNAYYIGYQHYIQVNYFLSAGAYDNTSKLLWICKIGVCKVCIAYNV